MTPQKIYTTPAYSTFSDNIVDGNWSIVAVSRILVWQLCLLRTVKLAIGSSLEMIPLATSLNFVKR